VVYSLFYTPEGGLSGWFIPCFIPRMEASQGGLFLFYTQGGASQGGLFLFYTQRRSPRVVYSLFYTKEEVS